MSIAMKRLWLRLQTSFEPISNAWMRNRLGTMSSYRLKRLHTRLLRSLT